MSAVEAVAAEAAGADRLELVRALDCGGLTPDYATVEAVTNAVRIPVRVMLRENASMQMAGTDELAALTKQAQRFQGLRIDGFVMGWITDSGEVDLATLERVLQAIGDDAAATFHRAFEHLADPFEGLRTLKRFPQINRLLTNGGAGSWSERKRHWQDLRAAALPEIEILAGGGLSGPEARELMTDAHLREVHVGRAARTPAENSGVIDASKIRQLKRAE